MLFLSLIKFISLVEKAKKNNIIYDAFQILLGSVSLDQEYVIG